MERQAQRAVPRHLVGAHGPGNGRNRIVRVRSRGWLDPRRAARTGAWWDAVPRRGRRHAADDAGQDLARADRSELRARWRDRKRVVSGKSVSVRVDLGGRPLRIKKL